MRWWTRARLNDPDFDDWDAASADYWKHIDEIRTQLPADLSRLLNHSLHDSHIELSMLDLVRRRARIQFRKHDALIDCRYGAADFGDSNLHSFEQAVEALLPVFHSENSEPVSLRPFATVLHDEVTVIGEGRYRHSILVEPLGDISIDFDDFRLTVSDLKGIDAELHRRTWLLNEWSTPEEIIAFDNLIAQN